MNIEYVFLGFGAYIAAFAFVGLIRSKVWIGGRWFGGEWVSKEKSPIAYWGIVAVYFAAGVWLLAVGVRDMSDRRAGKNMDLPPKYRDMFSEQ